jgi:hypothetical protein
MAAPKNMTPEQRRLRASLAASTRWSREDPKPQAERGQAGLVNKFRREVIADAAAKGETLSHAEIERRTKAKQSAHMKGLSYRRSRQQAA